jgi:hypothetical protein
MEFNLNDRVRCSQEGAHANKLATVKKVDTLQLEKTKACIIKFDDDEGLVMMYSKYLTKI